MSRCLSRSAPLLAVPLALLPLLAGGLLLAACAGSAPHDAVVDVRTNPYAAFPGPTSLDPIATPPEPRPITARITERATVDPQVFLFLDRLTAAVERRSWGAAALFLDEEGFRDQMRFLTDSGIAPQRAAAETLTSALGLYGGDSPIFPSEAERDTAPFLGLDRIDTMTVQQITVDAATGLWQASGYVRIDDRETHEFALSIVREPHGFRLVVPQG